MLEFTVIEPNGFKMIGKHFGEGNTFNKSVEDLPDQYVEAAYKAGFVKITGRDDPPPRDLTAKSLRLK